MLNTRLNEKVRFRIFDHINHLRFEVVVDVWNAALSWIGYAGGGESLMGTTKQSEDGSSANNRKTRKVSASISKVSSLPFLSQICALRSTVASYQSPWNDKSALSWGPLSERSCADALNHGRPT